MIYSIAARVSKDLSRAIRARASFRMIEWKTRFIPRQYELVLGEIT